MSSLKIRSNDMDIKFMVVGAVVLVAVAGGSFYGGMQYQKGDAAEGAQFRGGFAEGGMGQRQGGMGAGGTRMTQGMGGGFTMGEIISKDATGITIKMQDGSTKIVLVGESTQVMKSAAGSAADLVVGESVTVTGAADQNGIITAQSVQLRPAGQAQVRGNN